MMYIMMGEKKVAQYDADFKVKILDDKCVPLFILNGGNVKEWIAQRALNGERANSRTLKSKYGLSRTASDFASAMKMDAAKITDNFWVKGENDSRTYEDIKFKTDDFFALALYRDTDCMDKEPTRTPELTNIGAQEKGWKLIDGEWWLYKREPVQEIISEYITFRIGEEMGFDMAKYEVIEEGAFIRTKDFTMGKYNLQHANSIVKDHEDEGIYVADDDLAYNYRTFSDINPELGKQYIDICMLDALCENFDRHTENYGVLTDPTTGEIIRLAPNYDNNHSIYSNFSVSSERNKAYMKAFLSFLEKEEIKISVPDLSEESIDLIINEAYEMTTYKFDKTILKAYIMNGYALLKNREREQNLNIQKAQPPFLHSEINNTSEKSPDSRKCKEYER